MATLKEHQAAMVDLLANGSGIPASASRLAHAVHDLIGIVMLQYAASENAADIRALFGEDDATTPGLNDKALSNREKALKTDSPAKWPTPSEQRVKELENTIRQLKEVNAEQRDRLRSRKKLIDNLQGDNAKLKGQLALVREQRDDELRRNMEHEQADRRKEDTQVCEHAWANMPGLFIMPGSVHNREPYEFCTKCGAKQ